VHKPKATVESTTPINILKKDHTKYILNYIKNLEKIFSVAQGAIA